jgi:hypothetical protein
MWCDRRRGRRREGGGGEGGEEEEEEEEESDPVRWVVCDDCKEWKVVLVSKGEHERMMKQRWTGKMNQDPQQITCCST